MVTSCRASSKKRGYKKARLLQVVNSNSDYRLLQIGEQFRCDCGQVRASTEQQESSARGRNKRRLKIGLVGKSSPSVVSQKFI